MSEFQRLGALERIETMRQMHAEMLALPKGSQERRVLEHKLAEFLRGRAVETEPVEEPFEFDPRKAAANDV